MLPISALAASLALFAAAGTPDEAPWPFGSADPKPSVSKTPAKVDPIAFVRDRLADPSKPFTMIVHIDVKADSASEFTKLANPVQELAQHENGVISYQVVRGAQAPASFVISESWNSLADLEKHLSSDAAKALLAKLPELTSRTPTIEVFTPLPAGN